MTEKMHQLHNAAALFGASLWFHCVAGVVVETGRCPMEVAG